MGVWWGELMGEHWVV
jgi:hypothetical protein